MLKFHEEETAMNRRHQTEREDAEWAVAQKRMAAEDEVYKHQQKLEETYQDFKLKQEGEALRNRYEQNIDFLKAHAEDVKNPPALYPTAGWNCLTGSTFGMQKNPVFSGASEATLQETNQRLDNVETLLN